MKQPLTPLLRSFDQKSPFPNKSPRENDPFLAQKTPSHKIQNPFFSSKTLGKATTPLKNSQLLTEFLGDNKQKSQMVGLSEDQIKKKVLANLGPDKDQTLEAFKKYLQALIERKINANKQSNGLPKKDPESLLKQKLESRLHSRHAESSPKDTKLDEEIDKEDELAIAPMKHEKILMTSKKLRDRMKTEKVDKAARFYKHKIKHFSNLDTFINAKEFFEDLNPFKEFNPDRQTTRQYHAKKHLLTLKKLQKQSNDFFDQKIKEFTERMTELNNENVEIGVKIHEKNSESDISSNSSSSDLSELMKEDRRNPTKILTAPYPILHSRPTLNQENFSDNINFLEKQLGMNKSVIDFFKEFYDPKGQLKKNKQKVSDLEVMRGSVMRHLLVTDQSLNRLDCQIENNEDFNQLDGFYNQTLDLLTKEKQSKQGNLKNEDFELGSLIRLEKLLESIIKRTKRKKEFKSEKEQENKYNDYKEKSNKLLTLIDKTSRTIFREKHKEYNEMVTNVNKQIKAYQRRSMGTINSLKKSTALGIYLTSLDPEGEKSSQKSRMKPPHMKSPSISFPISQGADQRQTMSSFQNEIAPISDRKQQTSLYIKNTKNFFETFNSNTHNVLPTVKKKAIRTISSIIERVDTIQDVYQKEREHLGVLENECDKFFKETKKRINPPLESISSTLEHPKLYFKFSGYKKTRLPRKHLL